MGFSLLLQSAEISDLTNEAFTNLIDNKGELSKEQNAIILELTKLYKSEKKLVDLIDKKVLTDLFDFVKEITNTKPWYGPYIHANKLSEEAIHYFLNDPIYYNKVINYETVNLESHLSITVQFRNKGQKIYSELSDYLQLPKDTLIVKDLSKHEHLLGFYKNDELKEFDVQIKKDNGYFLLIVKNKSDSLVVQSSALHPYSDSTFMLGSQFGTLLFENNKKVSRIILEIGSRKKELERIN